METGGGGGGPQDQQRRSTAAGPDDVGDPRSDMRAGRGATSGKKMALSNALAVLVDPTQKCTKEDRTNFIPCIKKGIKSIEVIIIC